MRVNLQPWLQRVTILVAGSVLSAAQAANWSVPSQVLDGCGGTASNAMFRTVIAAQQPCPTSATRDHRFRNTSGFLTTFTLRPGHDGDRDGRADELDPDNDNDGLADDVELGGGAFVPATVTDPNQADADGDGASDGAESVAGTNPMDAESVLAITQAGVQAGECVLVWRSRAPYRYDVLAGDSVEALRDAPAVLETVTGVGGAGLWAETASTSRVPIVTGPQMFAIRVQGAPGD